MLKLKLQHLGHVMWRADSLAKTLMLGKIKGGRRRGGQDEMVGWHHRLDGHEFEHALGGTDWQRSLVCCSPRGRKGSGRTQRLNTTRSPALASTESLTHGARVPPGGQIRPDPRNQWPEKPRTRLRDRNHQGHRHSNCNDGNTLSTPHGFPAVLNSGLARFWGDRPLLDIHMFSLKQWL